MPAMFGFTFSSNDSLQLSFQVYIKIHWFDEGSFTDIFTARYKYDICKCPNACCLQPTIVPVAQWFNRTSHQRSESRGFESNLGTRKFS